MFLPSHGVAAETAVIEFARERDLRAPYFSHDLRGHMTPPPSPILIARALPVARVR